MSANRWWFSLYVVVALFTLTFQVWVRSFQCSGFTDCGLSFAKAAVWATIWPVSWIVYVSGLSLFITAYSGNPSPRVAGAVQRRRR